MPSCLVTGASGFIAGHLIKQLLEQNWKVTGTVRSLKNEDKISFLREFTNSSSNLTLVEADLLTPGSFDEHVKNVDIVFHTASPVVYATPNPQDVIGPALDGTKNVLNAVAKLDSNSRPRIVITGSCVSIMVMGPNAPNKEYTEEDWNDVATPENGVYYYSKVVAERAAWSMAKEHGLSVVVINPSYVVGPVLTNNKSEALNPSSEIWKKYFDGSSPKVTPFAVPIVDVRDVAKAHILAAQNDKAVGNRYICCSGSDSVRSAWDLVCVLRQEYPENKRIPTEEPAFKGNYMRISGEKIKRDLGMTFISPEQSVKDCVASLIQKGLVQ